MSDQEFFTVSLDAGAIILDFNQAASDISGYAAEEVIGKNWFEIFIPNENLLEVLEVFNSLFYGENASWEFTNEITCKDGTQKTLHWKNSIVYDKRNKPILIYSLGELV